MILLTISEGYSQKIILDKTESLFCFTKEQGRFLLKRYYLSEELDSINRILEKELEVKELAFIQRGLIISNKDTEINTQKNIITGLNSQIASRDKKIKGLKIITCIVVGLTVAVALK